MDSCHFSRYPTLPLDSCSSLSLVSQAHVEVICKTPTPPPTMQFTKLSTHLPVSVANPHAQLKAIGTVHVPIIWENGRASIFPMLVAPLAWPLLFGQNHLRMIQAHTDHAGLKVRFDHPSLKFTITCCDENPFVAFPSLANQNSSQPQKTVHSSHSSVLPPTCLLTPRVLEFWFPKAMIRSMMCLPFHRHFMPMW